MKTHLIRVQSLLFVGLFLCSSVLVGCSTARQAETGPAQQAAAAPLVYTAAAQPLPEGARFNPVVQDIEGWTVHVEPALLKDGERAELGEASLEMLANHLQRIKILLPKEKLEAMQKLEIWIEYKHPELGGMQYHPGRRWLVGKGYDPRLAKKFHIPRAEALLSRGQMLKHPAVVLHELAHAYHDQVLGFDDERVLKGYRQAMDKGLYDKVLLYTGQQVRHYAATDHKEYFSEATEAYFYRNDFYPFVAAELNEHDPETYKLMQEIWGPLR